MPTVTSVDGTTIAYTDTGAPEGRSDAPTVVFGHGLLFGGWMFGPQIAALRDHYRCVTLDWRGQGESPSPSIGYDMDTLTGDALALIRRLDVGPVHWVGLSMGGFVGLRLAARHGAALRSLALLDTSAAPEVPRSARAYRRLALVQRIVGIRPVLGRVETLMFGPSFRADAAHRAVIEDWADRLARADRVGVHRAVLGVADRTGVEGELPAVAVPTLVVVGADDVATPPVHAQRIAELIPGARLETVRDCGHTSTLEQSAVVSGLLAGFLASVQYEEAPFTDR